MKLQGQHNGFALGRIAASKYPRISVVVASSDDRPDPNDMPEAACFIVMPFSDGIAREHLPRMMPDDQRPMPVKE